MSGTYPLSLLQSALHIQRGLASGRFRYFASSILNDMSSLNPLQEIEQVSTSLVIGGNTPSETSPKQCELQQLVPRFPIRKSSRLSFTDLLFGIIYVCLL